MIKGHGNVIDAVLLGVDLRSRISDSLQASANLSKEDRERAVDAITAGVLEFMAEKMNPVSK